jgi:thiol-disulfide isomerase/thioredoxin
MRRILVVLFLNSVLASGLLAQKISRIKMTDLENRLQDTDTVFVVNFWATWCGPCVAELPEFNRIDSVFFNKPVKVLLISLDFPEAWPIKLKEFLNKKQIRPEVMWLDESDANAFIPKISTTWSGAIPATLFSYKTKGVNSNAFHEGKVTYDFLFENIILSRKSTCTTGN